MNQLPQDPADGQAREARPSCTQEERVCRVLLVEDCPNAQQLLLRILKIAGAEVTLECNGQAAIDRLASSRSVQDGFDLIVTDLRMPVLDGIEMTRRLRKEGCTIPIVMCSAEMGATVQEQALDAGCNSFLSKSSAYEELGAHVRRFTGDVLNHGRKSR